MAADGAFRRRSCARLADLRPVALPNNMPFAPPRRRSQHGPLPLLLPQLLV